MRTRRRRAVASAACVVSAAVVLGSIVPASGQSQVNALPRTADGRPNLTGIWQVMNTANWDIQAAQLKGEA